MEEDQRLLERIIDGAEDPTNLSLQLLKDITANFSPERKIGQGGFGEVFKGVLGEKVVAVKRIHINENTFDDRLFRREFLSLWNTSHRNVVRFLGFCSNTYQKTIQDAGSGEAIFASVLERLLCFEYISNGSLDKHITDELRGLEWEMRYEIITGICEGLRYLHKEKKIIHMDLKPENILLHHQDEKYMLPKITDFGLSRLNENSHTVGTRFGTRGYMAPEYEKYGETTFMSDIYSLGAIIIELVTGCMEVPNKDNVLRRWRHRWNKPPTQLQYQQVTRCIDIAGRCREQKPEARPSVSMIINFLRKSESTYAQISPRFDEDDMLRIKSLELRLQYELRNQISRSIELTNGTRNCIAFNIQLPSVKYIAQPEKGIVQPESKCGVTITIQPRDSDDDEKFIVKSMKVSQVLIDKDITESMFEEASKAVDEVNLKVVYEPTKSLENSKRREDTKIPAEEVPEAKKRKIVESASGNAEATSMDINSDVRGQCTAQTGQCNLHILQSFSRHYPTNKKYLGDKSRAVDSARGAMGSLLDKLGKLVTEGYNLETSIERDIKSFSEDLRNMHRDLPKLQNVDGANDWVDEVRELSYHIEDMVDSFLVHVEPNSGRSGGFKELKHEGLKLLVNGMPTHYNIEDVIRDIKEKVQDVANRKEKYNIDVKDVVADATVKDTIDPRILGIHIDREQLIGIEEPKLELIRLFEEGDVSKLKIISIVGLGGLGKTTLAQAVYDELKAQYNHRSFIPVGQNPDVQKVLRNILLEFGQDLNAANLEVWQLCKKLRELLENKRYFIVIDDIWNSSEWNVIRTALPENKNGSRVMITTRDHDIAFACCNLEIKYVYRIKQLSDEDSKILFFGRIFGSKEACPDTLKEISDDILKRCSGMPLAINSIASLLASKKYTTWERVWKSLGAMIKRNTVLENMKQILELSYIYLPDHLRTCLLHVCTYPEDREIDKYDLLRQWVAEGLVSTDGDLDAEDEAEDYFQTLINRCMILPGRIDYDNEVLSCRVHDIIIDLMRSKSTEVNFIQVIDGSKDYTGAGEIRRVSVQRNDKEDGRILETINKRSLSHARSVLLYRASLTPDFLEYKYVRVLHIEDDNYHTDLDLTGISSLFFLRYLKITCRFTDGEFKLPDQIGQLQQLETIDLHGGRLNKCPSDIVTLLRLSHLRYYFPFGDLMLPYGFEKLKSLHTLVGVCVGQCSVETIKCLGELTNLRNLLINSKFNSESEEVASARMNALHSSISRLSTSLTILELKTLKRRLPEGYDLSSWSRTPFPAGSQIQKLHLSKCIFERCPEWIGQLHYLYSLSIEVREVADGLTIVGGLPSLAYFHLCVENSNAEKEENVAIPGSGAFQALKHLYLKSRKTSLTFEERAMPKLEMLQITFRYNIIRRLAYRLPARDASDNVPLQRVGIQHLPAPTLKEISLTVTDMWDDWKVMKSSTCQRTWEIKARVIHTLFMLARAFELHHPSADIKIDFDDEDFCWEDYLTQEDDESVDEEEDDESVDEVKGPQSSTQAQDNTRQSLQLIEAQEDSGRMSISTDAPLMVNTSVDLAVGSEGWHGGRGSQDLAVLEYSQLPFTGLLAPLPPSLPPITWPDRAKPVANFPVDINNNLLVEHGNTGMLVKAIGQYLHLNQAPTGRLVDLSRAYLAVLESCQLPSTSLLAPLPPSHPPFTWPETAEPVANFPVDISNDLLVQQGHNDLLVQQGNICMLINAVAQYLDLNQAPTGVLVDLNHAYLAVLESLQLPFTSDLVASNQACNQLTDEEFLELSEYPYVNQPPPGGLAELNQAPNQLIDEEFVELGEDI